MTFKTIGFIGTGVMGEPMCRNLARKSGAQVYAYDRSTAPLLRLAAHGVKAAASLAEVVRKADIICMVLPSGKHVEAVCEGPEGICALAKPGQIVIDLGTSPVALAKRLDKALQSRGAIFADAPIARTRQAAEDGTLSIMVGYSPRSSRCWR